MAPRTRESGSPARPLGPLGLVSVIIGVGFVASLLAGLLVGALIGDVALGVGRTVTVGMGVAAVVAILAATRSRQR